MIVVRRTKLQTLMTLDTAGDPTCDFDPMLGMIKCAWDPSIFTGIIAACDAQDGEIADVVLLQGLDGSCTEAGGFPITYTLPVCIVEECDFATGFVAINYMIQMFSEGSEEPCQLEEGKAEGTAGLKCFEGTLDLYGTELVFDEEGISVNVTETTDLTPFSPAIVLEEIPEEFCKMEMDETGIKYVCNMETLGESADPPVDIEAVCEANGGRFESLHLSGSVEDEESGMTIDISVKHFPYCIHDSCVEGEGVEYADFIIEIVAGIDIDTVVHEGEVCDENMNGFFYLKMKDGEPLRKKCKWLRRRAMDKKMKICARENYPEGETPAYEACPASCCKCHEDPKNVFLKKKQKVDGVMTPFPATCNWLSRLEWNKRKKYCKKNGRFEGILPNASSACPETCRVCPTDMRK